MSQVNNPIGIDKTRPREWQLGEIAKYLRSLELFIKQVYENLTDLVNQRILLIPNLAL